ncbi:hypothetical protein D3C80_930580 [compost metagenome]
MVLAPVILQPKLGVNKPFAVQAQAQFAAVAVAYLDAVMGAAKAVMQDITRPACRQQRLQVQGVATALQAQQAFDDQAVHPAGRAGVPAPATPPGVGRNRIDVGGHHIGFDLVGIDQRVAALAHRVDQAQQFPGLVGIAQVRVGHARPDGRMGVLPAVFTHPWQVPLDVARVQLALVEGWVEQFDDADVTAYQVAVQRRHGQAGTFGRSDARQHRPALRQRVDAAFLVARRTQYLAVVEPGAAIPAAVPGVRFQFFGECGGLGGATQRKGAVALAQGDAAECPQHLMAKEAQPHAFALPLFADPVHAVVPVAAAHQRQAMGAALQGVAEGTLTMLVQALGQGRLSGQIVVGLFTGIECTAFQIAGRLVKHGVVPGNLYVAAGGQRQPQQVVRAAGTHPALQRWVPPVLHVAFGILMRSAGQQVLTRRRRRGMDHGHAVLQLVAKTDGTARLVKAAARPEPAGDHLVHQPAVGQHIQCRFRRLDLHGVQGAPPVGADLVELVHGGLQPPVLLHAAGSGAGVPGGAQAEHHLPAFARLQLQRHLQCRAGVQTAAGTPRQP